MKNIIFVFAVSFCAMFAANVALATAPEGDTPGEYDDKYIEEISNPHDDIFDILDPTDEDGADAGIAGVTYVNRAVNSAGAAATAAEAHAAAAGAYAVSAKASADTAAKAADDAAKAAGNANAALAQKADKNEIPTVNDATLTIQRNGEDVGTFTANASAAKTIDIVDNDTIYTLPTATADTLGGVMVDTELSSSSTNPVQNKVVEAALADKADKNEIPTVNDATLTIQRNGTTVDTFTANASAAKTINIVDNDTIYTLPKASDEILGGVKVGENLSIDDDGVLSATVPTGTLASKDTITNAEVAEDAAIAQSKIDGLTTALSGKQATLTTENVVTDGTGNVVTAVTAADGTVTVTKGTTLGTLATKSEVTTGDIANDAVTADKTTGIIGKVPSGSENSTDLASIWVQ